MADDITRLAQILQEYVDDIEEDVDKLIDDVSDEGVLLLKATSPKDRGKYAKGWKKKKKKYSRNTRSTLYNKTPGLPHLLEHPHVTRNGGYSRPQAHIKPVEDKVVANLENGVVSIIKKRSE